MVDSPDRATPAETVRALLRATARSVETAATAGAALDAIGLGGVLVDGIGALGGQARAFALDSRREAQVSAFFEQVESEVGPVDVVVFNVGFPVL